MVNYDLANAKTLNLGNSYTYTTVAADHTAYRGFFLTAAGTVTVGGVTLTVGINEEVPLMGNITTIVANAADNVLIFTYGE